MHLFLGLLAGYAIMFGLMKLGASPKLGVPMFWITFLGVAFWSAVFSPWAKAEAKRTQKAQYEQWKREEEERRLKEEERKKREREADERRRKEREQKRKEAEESATRCAAESARRTDEQKSVKRDSYTTFFQYLQS